MSSTIKAIMNDFMMQLFDDVDNFPNNRNLNKVIRAETKQNNNFN